MNETQNASLRAIAVIIKAFGIKGELKIRSYARTVDEYSALKSVLVGHPGRENVLLSISRVTKRGDDIYLQFSEYPDRTAAEPLVGAYLFVPEDEKKILPEGRVFIDELIGMRIVKKNGAVLGTLAEVLTLGRQTLYEIETDRGKVLMPAVEPLIVKVIPEKRQIIVDPPDGMFDGEMA